MAHQPALDGLRGLAVAGVVCFHAGLTFMSAAGATLTVSTFFTLSGYLITSLLVLEWEDAGRVALGRFWGRRARRLLPAALAGLVLVVAFGAVAATDAQRRDLGADVVAAFANVANWRFLLADRSYGDLFADPSPVQHYWSLAVEEQFYVVFPPLLVGLLVLLRSRRRAGAALGALAVALALVPVLVRVDTDRLYYGTDLRAPELLAGALLALALAGRDLPAWVGRAAAVLGPVAFAVLVGSWTLLPDEAAWLYRGGYAAYALVSVAVVVAAITPGGPVRSVLAVAPLQWLGRSSYSIYLVHWPVFLWVDGTVVDLAPLPLLAVRLAVTLVLAVLLQRLVEEPVRAGRVLASRRAFATVLPVAGLAVVGAAVVTARGAAPPATDFAALQDLAVETQAAAGPEPAFSVLVPEPPPGGLDAAVAATPDVPEPAGPPTVVVVGDSNALVLGAGLHLWGQEHGGLDVVIGAQMGCGIGRGGERTYEITDEVPEACERWPADWSDLFARAAPDAVLVLNGPWDTADRRLDGDEVWRAAGDPVYDAYLRDELRLAAEVLTAPGVPVLWFTSPYISIVGPDEPYPASDPARMDRVNALVREVAAAFPSIQVVDLGAALDELLPGGQLDPAHRPDGIHLNEAGLALVTPWAASRVLEATG